MRPPDAASVTDVGESTETVMLQLEDPIRVIERGGDTRGNGQADGWELLHDLIVGGCTGIVQITSKPSIHRVSRSLPRVDSAFQDLDVCKALPLVFRCLTDSGRFARSRSIEDDLLRLW